MTGASHPETATGTFSGVANMSDLRADFTANLLPDGKVLLTGGTNFSSSSPGAELYQ